MLQYLLISNANVTQKSSGVNLAAMRTVDNGNLEPASYVSHSSSGWTILKCSCSHGILEVGSKRWLNQQSLIPSIWSVRSSILYEFVLIFIPPLLHHVLLPPASRVTLPNKVVYSLTTSIALCKIHTKKKMKKYIVAFSSLFSVAFSVMVYFMQKQYES